MESANDVGKIEVSPLAAFREARGLSRRELVSIVDVEEPPCGLEALSNTLALVEAGLWTPGRLDLEPLWRCLGIAGHGELLARQEQWYDKKSNGQ